MEALRIIAESWPLASVVITGIVVGGICWTMRRGTYNHQAYLEVRDERDRLLHERSTTAIRPIRASND
jgi:hypothetical protein